MTNFRLILLCIPILVNTLGIAILWHAVFNKESNLQTEVDQTTTERYIQAKTSDHRDTTVLQKFLITNVAFFTESPEKKVLFNYTFTDYLPLNPVSADSLMKSRKAEAEEFKVLVDDDIIN